MTPVSLAGIIVSIAEMSAQMRARLLKATEVQETPANATAARLLKRQRHKQKTRFRMPRTLQYLRCQGPHRPTPVGKDPELSTGRVVASGGDGDDFSKIESGVFF
jgi:hypothetical protein